MKNSPNEIDVENEGESRCYSVLLAWDEDEASVDLDNYEVPEYPVIMNYEGANMWAAEQLYGAPHKTFYAMSERAYWPAELLDEVLSALHQGRSPG